MRKPLLILSAFVIAASAFGADQPEVHIEPSNLHGPRPLQDQTATAAIRDYLQSWQTLNSALEQNRPDLLDRDFVGSALDKLAGTVQEQRSLGISASYQDRSHDLQILFYSPDGLSIEVADKVEYDVQIFDQGKLQATRRVLARYIAVLTPTEVRWRVRVLQAQTE